MTDQNHTPGPWMIGGSMISNGKTTIALVLRRPAVYGGKACATRDTDTDAPETGAEIAANARLLAQAPAMRAALLQIMAILDQPVQHSTVQTDGAARILRADAEQAFKAARAALELPAG